MTVETRPMAEPAAMSRPAFADCGDPSMVLPQLVPEARRNAFFMDHARAVHGQ